MANSPLSIGYGRCRSQPCDQRRIRRSLATQPAMHRLPCHAERPGGPRNSAIPPCYSSRSTPKKRVQFVPRQWRRLAHLNGPINGHRSTERLSISWFQALISSGFQLFRHAVGRTISGYFRVSKNSGILEPRTRYAAPPGKDPRNHRESCRHHRGSTMVPAVSVSSGAWRHPTL